MGFVDVTEREFPTPCCTSSKVSEEIKGDTAIKAVECVECRQIWLIEFDQRGESFWTKKWLQNKNLRLGL